MFTKEAELEQYIRSLLLNQVLNSNPEFLILDNKGVFDIIICRNTESPMLYFLEIKFHKPSNSRLGFGSKKGKGCQPEILLRRPSYFETQVRWLLCRLDDSNYYFLPNSQISKYYSKGRIGKKYNNFQVKLFKKEKGLDEIELIQELKTWLGIPDQL